MENSWEESVSAETEGPCGDSLLWGDWNIAGSESNYLSLGWFYPSEMFISSITLWWTKQLMTIDERD